MSRAQRSYPEASVPSSSPSSPALRALMRMKRTPGSKEDSLPHLSGPSPLGLSNIRLSRCISHIPGSRKDQVLTTLLAPASLCLCPCFSCLICQNGFLKPKSTLPRQPRGGVLYDPRMLWGCPCLEKTVPLALPVKPPTGRPGRFSRHSSQRAPSLP